MAKTNLPSAIQYATLGDASTSTLNTWIDVPGTLVLTEGSWDVEAVNITVAVASNASATHYGNLMIADLANNILDNSLALGSNTVTVAATSGFCLSTKARVNVPPGTTLTVKLRLRFGLSSSTGSVTFGATTYTGSLTDPEVSPKFFAKRAA